MIAGVVIRVEPLPNPKEKPRDPGFGPRGLSGSRIDRLLQSAFLIASARSVFSHENPPSSSGVRPKWP